MQLRKLTVDPALPISVAAAKKALRIDHAFEDEVIARKLRAAVELVEARTNRVLRATVFEASFDAWPCWKRTELDLGVTPIREVVEVAYVPEGGNARTIVAPALYDWRRAGSGGELYFYTAFTSPEVSTDRRSPIAVKFEAGYDAAEPGDDPELALPDRVAELVLLLAGHWFKHREAATAADVAEVPFSAKMLFQELRVFR